MVNYSLGNNGGERLHLLTIEEMPAHQHTPVDGISFLRGWDPSGGASGVGGGGAYGRVGVSTALTNAVGGSLPHNNMMPFIAIHWIIKL